MNELGLPNQPTLLNRVTLGNGLPLSELCSSPTRAPTPKPKSPRGSGDPHADGWAWGIYVWLLVFN